MPAPTTAPAATASASASPRNAPQARADRSGDNHFGRQLDAVRQQQAPDEKTGQQPLDPLQPPPPATAVAQAHPGDVCTLAAATDDSDTDADTAAQASITGVPQCVLTLFLPATVASAGRAAAQTSGSAVASAALGSVTGGAPGNAGVPGLPATPAGDPLSSAQLMATAIEQPAAWLALTGLKAGEQDSRSSDNVTAALGPAVLPAGPAGSAAIANGQIAAPAGSPDFAPELGQQISWFANHDIKQARIRLHPEELGMLDLKITVQHGKVDVAFIAQHPGAVLALQQSLPQLDQLLAQHGLSLGHSEVSQQGRDDAPRQGHGNGGADAVGDVEVHAAGIVSGPRSVNLLDAFA